MEKFILILCPPNSWVPPRGILYLNSKIFQNIFCFPPTDLLWKLSHVFYKIKIKCSESSKEHIERGDEWIFNVTKFKVTQVEIQKVLYEYFSPYNVLQQKSNSHGKLMTGAQSCVSLSNHTLFYFSYSRCGMLIYTSMRIKKLLHSGHW